MGTGMNLKTSFVLHFSLCPVSALYQGQFLISSSARSLEVQPGPDFQCYFMPAQTCDYPMSWFCVSFGPKPRHDCRR
jgi:hypothetical protein